MEPFPRQRCLGYIEAAVPANPTAVPAPNFRGNAASATLKLTASNAAGAVSRRFPRQRCLGYIEARQDGNGYRPPVRISEATLPRLH